MSLGMGLQLHWLNFVRVVELGNEELVVQFVTLFSGRTGLLFVDPFDPMLLHKPAFCVVLYRHFTSGAKLRNIRAFIGLVRAGWNELSILPV